MQDKSVPEHFDVVIVGRGPVGATLANLFGLLTPIDGNASSISCIAGNFDIKQGIASTRGTVVETPGATVVGTGHIDLRNERIDMRVDPKSKNLNLSALAVPMRITGLFSTVSGRNGSGAVASRSPNSSDSAKDSAISPMICGDSQ